MELTEHSFLEELIMAPKIETSFSHDQFFPNPWNFTSPNFDQIQTPDLHFPACATNSSFLELISPVPDHQFNYPCPFGEFQPFFDALTSPEYAAFYEKADHDLPPMALADQEDHYAVTTTMENNNTAQVGSYLDHQYGMNCFEDGISSSSYKVESSTAQSDVPHMENSNINDVVEGLYGEIMKKSKSRKANGQPSKNLMAERRRRKRLNDRLSMLRSIVPKISKMDRTSILGDTIDFMRELLEKINKLREEGIDENADKINLIGNNLKELKPNDMLVRNPPKFDVERRDDETRVEVCCTAKPGLLLSTLSTFDALGLDIQQCVISCFSDFSMQASCNEVAEHRSLVSCEDVKQALFRNAGYGGRCL